MKPRQRIHEESARGPTGRPARDTLGRALGGAYPAATGLQGWLLPGFSQTAQPFVNHPGG